MDYIFMYEFITHNDIILNKIQYILNKSSSQYYKSSSMDIIYIQV